MRNHFLRYISRICLALAFLFGPSIGTSSDSYVESFQELGKPLAISEWVCDYLSQQELHLLLSAYDDVEVSVPDEASGMLASLWSLFS